MLAHFWSFFVNIIKPKYCQFCPLSIVLIGMIWLVVIVFQLSTEWGFWYYFRILVFLNLILHKFILNVFPRYYGGWAAPNIYFLGFAGVVKFGNIRIGGLSGIYNSRNYYLGWLTFTWLLCKPLYSFEVLLIACVNFFTWVMLYRDWFHLFGHDFWFMLRIFMEPTQLKFAYRPCH